MRGLNHLLPRKYPKFGWVSHRGSALRDEMRGANIGVVGAIVMAIANALVGYSISSGAGGRDEVKASLPGPGGERLPDKKKQRTRGVPKRRKKTMRTSRDGEMERT
jgi:hypothetical protein